MFKIVSAICAIGFAGELAVLWLFPFQECPDKQLCGEFHHVSGHAYYRPFWADMMRADSTDNMTSTVELYEDGVRLGPSHSDVGEIGTEGHGRFIYFESSMLRGFYFSASDNSDPNTNGRTYTTRDPKAIDPYLAVKEPEAVTADRSLAR